MKKVYIQPIVKATVIKFENMLAASPEVINPDVDNTGVGDEGDAKGELDFGW